MATKKKTAKKAAPAKVPERHLFTAFPTYVLRDKFEVSPISKQPIAEFNAGLAYEIMRLRTIQGDEVVRSNHGPDSWHSKDSLLHDLPEPYGKELAQMFRDLFNEFCNQHTPADKTLARAFKMSAWAMMMRNGGYSTPHCHPNCHFSAVYYVDTGPENNEKQDARKPEGLIEFFDTRNVNLKIEGSTMTPSFRWKPVAGELLVFPSWLPHMVHPVYGPEDRISVACNGSLHKTKKIEE